MRASAPTVPRERDGGNDRHRRIRTGDDADEQDPRELVNHFAAEQQQRDQNDHDRA